MKLKRQYLLIFVVLMGIVVVSQVKSLLANYNIVEDMTLTTSMTSLKEGETLTVSVTDSNIEDTKLVIPVDENTEYMASDYQDASVVFDQINHQVVIDWLEPSKEQKEVTIKLKMTKEGSYPLKALTVRENQEVSTKEENIEVIALEELKEEPKEESLDTEIDESSQESLTEGPTSEKLDNTDKEASALWGTCPWNFDKENGILTIEPGELGTVKESPWNVCNKVAYSSIKKIVFTGKTVAPIDSSYLFTNESVSVLSNIEEIEGIPYLDTSKTMNMSYMFFKLRKVKDLDVGNFETGNVTNMMYMFDETKSIKTLDISNFDTSSVESMSSMFSGMSNIQSIDVSKWNTGNVTHMGGMFSGMSNIQSIDVSKWNTGNVKSMHGMFSGMSNIQSLDLSNFDTGNVTSMESMFSSMINIQNLDLSNFDTENVETMRMMFYSMTNLLELDIGNFNTKNVRNFQRMFEEVLKLKSLDVSKFDTGNGTLMDGMFAHMASVENLNVSNFKTGNVTNMSNMFREMSNIQSLDFSNFDTENVTDMSNMFYRCNIKNLNFSNFETRNVTNMSNMFREMSNVQSLNLSNFDTKNVTNMSNMFYRNSIRNLDLSNFDTEKVTNMNGMLREISLNKLILEKKFKFGVLVGLSAPTYLNGNDRLTGKWIREDGESKGYSPTDFMANYGTNDLTPGAYVGEIIPRGKITGEAKLTNQTHSAGLFYVNDKVKLENVLHHEGEIWNPLYKTVIPEELTINQESFKGYMILEGGNRVDLPNEVFKFDESSRLFEMNLKSIMEPSGNDNYYSKVDFDVYYEISATLNKDAIGETFKIETTINYFNPLLEKYNDVKLTTKNSDIYGLEPEWTLEKELKNLSRPDELTAVGDELEFTITATNSDELGAMKAFDMAENSFPNELDFISGSAELILPDGTTKKLPNSVYQPNKQMVSTNVFSGNGYVGVKPYQLRFKAKVKDTAYGKIIETKATLKGTTHAGKELTIEDDMVEINVAYSGKLGFKETPKTLSFKDSFISAYTSTIERKDADWGVSIEDTRVQKQPWNLSVKQVSPFESSEGDKLTQVMIFRKNGIEDKGIDVDNEVDVYSENSSNPNDYFISWQKNEGFFLKVPPGTAKAKQYQTELQWNLKDTPI